MSAKAFALQAFDTDQATAAHHEPFKVIMGGKVAQNSSRCEAPVLQHQLAVFTALLALVVVLAGVCHLSDCMAAARVADALDGCVQTTVTVMPGDSLWHIAETHAVKGCSTAELVRHIEDTNHLESAQLSVGMQLQVPIAA